MHIILTTLNPNFSILFPLNPKACWTGAARCRHLAPGRVHAAHQQVAQVFPVCMRGLYQVIRKRVHQPVGSACGPAAVKQHPSMWSCSGVSVCRGRCTTALASLIITVHEHKT